MLYTWLHLYPGGDLLADNPHDQRPTSLYDQPSLSIVDTESISHRSTPNAGHHALKECRENQ